MSQNTNVHFVLREPNSTKPTPIILIYRFGSERLKYPTGQKINPAYWDTATQRPKKKDLPDAETKRQCKDLELLLNRFEDELTKINSVVIREKIPPTLDFYREELDKIFAEKPRHEKKKFTLITYAEEFIRQCKDKERLQPKKNIPYEYNTYKTYGVVLNRLKDFQRGYKKRLDFENINLHFYKEFTKFLTDENYAINYIGVCIKNVKVFMRNAYKDGLHTNLTFEDGDFTKPSEDVMNTYLNDTELQKLFTLDLSKNKKLDRVRDIFLIGCYTGLRKSDLNQLKTENIIHDGKVIKIKTQKTKE
jgi:integrase